MCCFINFTLKKLHFSIKKSSVRLLSYTFTSKYLAETDEKMTSRRQKRRQNRHTDVLHESRLTSHWCKTTFRSPGRVHGNPSRVCKKYSSVLTGYNASRLLTYLIIKFHVSEFVLVPFKPWKFFRLCLKDVFTGSLNCRLKVSNVNKQLFPLACQNVHSAKRNLKAE